MANSFYNLQVLIFFFLLPYASSVSFQINRFEKDEPNILYHGDAVASEGTIEFNRVSYSCRVGWATYAQSVPLWDRDTGKLSDFTTSFSFTIDTQNFSPPAYGHGFAFFLAPVGFEIPPNSAGGYLGLFNTTTSHSSINRIFLVEFDSYVNPEWDPGYEHVGINNNSITSWIDTSWNASRHTGDVADVQITYNATTKNFSVNWSYQRFSNSDEKTFLSVNVDLMKVLPEWITVGFSAATGKNSERHIIKSWEFSSSLNIDRVKGMKNRRSIVGIAVSGFALIVGIVVTASVLFWRKKKLRRREQRQGEVLTSIADLERGARPKMFSYGDLVLATNNFSSDRKLGQGGFGVVYKGYLSDLGVEVAVKKISRGSKQGKKEYITEVKIISGLRHRNLVQLIGWCHDKGEFLLVYEFMPNGSLDSHLFGKKNPLNWATRHKIALGLASALLYLHEEGDQCVVHRDIKSSNIMLDSGFNTKLGDFGLARLMDHELGPSTTGVAGTLGYMAPEYIYTGRASKESDVFSFGVVALEIATGKKSVDPMEKKSLVEWVWDLYGSGKLLLAVDEKLPVGFNKSQAECLMIVGLWCSHLDYSLRPSIRQAIQVINFEAEMPNLPTKMPCTTYRVPGP